MSAAVVCGSGRVLRAVRVVLAAQVAVAAVEELEHRGHVRRPLDVVAHHVGVGRGVGRLGVAVLDELVVNRVSTVVFQWLFTPGWNDFPSKSNGTVPLEVAPCETRLS